MGINKIVTYVAVGGASVVALIFGLDLAFGMLSPSTGRLIAMDVLFLLAAAFVIWQGIETMLELR